MSPRSTGPKRPRRSDSTRIGLVALGVIGIVIAIGVVLLFSGSSENAAERPTETTLGEMQYADGTLNVVEEGRLVMTPFEGDNELEFIIQDADLANFDLAHMQSHSSVALPTRIYYERDGDVLYARYKEDAPVNSQGGR